MSSIISTGTSAITLRFALSKSIDSAAQDVQAAINAAAVALGAGRHAGGRPPRPPAQNVLF